jgi:hypothetical protein
MIPTTGGSVLVTVLENELGLTRFRDFRRRHAPGVRVYDVVIDGHSVRAVSPEDAQAIREICAKLRNGAAVGATVVEPKTEPRTDTKIESAKKESGRLYAVQLVPELKPERIKLGFSDRLNDRLVEHRTAAPTLKLLHSWPCQRAWEKAAIAAIANGERQVGPEAFDFIDISVALKRGNRFFGLLPRVETNGV